MKVALIVSVGIIISSLAIDFDHIPGIIKNNKYSAFDCLLNPYCKPALVGQPLHKGWFVFIFGGLTVLSYLFSPNPLLTFLLMGLTIGLVVHMMTDNHWYPKFYDWYKTADNFKSKLFGIN